MPSISGERILAGLGIAVVIAAIVSGLLILGPPSVERTRRLDEKRVVELAAIGRAVDRYRFRNGKLPSSLAEIEQAAGAALSTHDPGTRQPYGFRVLDLSKYELCATFQRATGESRSEADDFWQHGAGVQCYVLQAHDVQP